MKNILSYIFIASVLILYGCIQENPNLVNPPSTKEKVRIRFINYSGDKKIRSLNMNGADVITSEYGINTAAVNPPDDSVFAAVHNGSAEEFKLSQKVQFLRDSYNTFFALPSPKDSKNYRNIDTLIQVSSSIGLPKNTVYSYLKVINAYPDSTITFSIVDGCPNGNALFSNVGYKHYSSQKQVRSGAKPISLIKHNKENMENLGLLDINLKNDSQYLIVISATAEGDFKLSVIDETSNEVSAMVAPNTINEKYAYLRTINLSSQAISVKKLPNESISTDVKPNYISNYDKISACTNQSIDSIAVEYSGFVPTTSSLSINVNKKYTYLVSDAGNKLAGFSIAIPEAEVDYLYADKALIRVINASDETKEYTLSVAGRADTTGNNYVSGETVASKIKYGKISNIYTLPIKSANTKIPLTLFSNTSPAKLLKSVSYNFDQGKSYLIIIKKDNTEKETIYIIEDNTQSEDAKELKTGQFFRLLNFVSGTPSIDISFNGIISNAKVSYLTSFSSVADVGANTININGKNHSFDANAEQRDILVATGTKDNVDIIDCKSENHPDLQANQAKFRFLNAAPAINNLTVVLGKATGDTIATELQYKQLTPYKLEQKERSYSIYFFNSLTNKLLKKIDEIRIVEGKIYTLIFGGDETTGYSIFVLQEY